MTSLATFELELNDDEIITFSYYDEQLQLKLLDDGTEVSLTPYEQEKVTNWIHTHQGFVNQRVNKFLRGLYDN